MPAAKANKCDLGGCCWPIREAGFDILQVAKKALNSRPILLKKAINLETGFSKNKHKNENVLQQLA
ncbi:MAG: hypothetical protein AMJ53_16230 [Gammaproteobacteria bacterium SG8_11]|nr:MAG: hypothetical protein AMJ53_16230 [Gammaproteobacteria bacterium SG8_11]